MSEYLYHITFARLSSSPGVIVCGAWAFVPLLPSRTPEQEAPGPCASDTAWPTWSLAPSPA